MKKFFNKRWIRATIVSVILAIVIIFGIVFYFGNGETINDTNGSDVGQDDIRVAAVGDSITDGLFAEENYPQELDNLLGEGYAVENFGESNYAAQSSADFPYETTNSFQNSLDFNPDIVILMMGTNDTKSNNWNGQDQFKQEYEELLEQYQNLSNVSRIILASPPQVFLGDVVEGSIDPDHIDQVGEVVEEVAIEQDLEYVDVYNETLTRSEWFPDGVHPNTEGAHALADLFYEQIEE